MLFIPENRDDIIKYFSKSYLKITEYGDKLFYIDSVDKYLILGKVDDGRDFKMYLSDEHPYTVDYILPHKSFFQYDKHAVQLSRIPARQYHRGITPQNTAMFYWAGEVGLGKVELSFNSLKAFVTKQKFFTLRQALLETIKQSCVLNSRMMFVPTNKQIYVDFEPIARVDDGKKIKLIRPLFKHELQQFLHTTNEQSAFAIVE